MSKISLVGASADDKASLLGPEFRNIEVLSAETTEDGFVVDVILNGKAITLIGDPRKALLTFLGGTAEPGEVASA